MAEQGSFTFSGSAAYVVTGGPTVSDAITQVIASSTPELPRVRYVLAAGASQEVTPSTALTFLMLRSPDAPFLLATDATVVSATYAANIDESALCDQYALVHTSIGRFTLKNPSGSQIEIYAMGAR